MNTILDDLYRHNDWANGHILRLCNGLTDAQLDEPRDLGPGSLRKTLYHVWMAEVLWLERWRGDPWHPLPSDPSGFTIAQITEGFRDVAAQRRELLDRERADGWTRSVAYLDLQKNPYQRPLRELLLHVANHGIHHRAQMLHYLKSFGRTMPAGLDYLFFRLAYPVVPQTDEAKAAFAKYGLEVAIGPGQDLIFDHTLLQRYYAYNDWAYDRLFTLAADLDEADFDRPFDMGPGSLRKTLLHTYDAERFWLRNWTEGQAPWDNTPPTTTLAELQTLWAALRAQRNAFLTNLDAVGAKRLVSVSFAGPVFQCQVMESMLQLCGHGTHHRAQMVNMVKQCGVPVLPFDYAVRLKEVDGI